MREDHKEYKEENNKKNMCKIKLKLNHNGTKIMRVSKRGQAKEKKIKN